MDDYNTNDWPLSPWLEGNLDLFWGTELDTRDETFNNFGTHNSLGVSTGVDGPSTIDTAHLDSLVDNRTFGIHEITQPLKTVPDPLSWSQMTQREPLQEPRARTLPRRRSKYILRRVENRTSPIAVPSGAISPYLSGGPSLAMQRWQNSPPEDEAASLSAICDALERRNKALSPSTSRPSSRDAFRKYRVPSSTTSLDSAASETSIRSGQSSKSGTSQTHRIAKSMKSRSKIKAKGRANVSGDRIFKCTFCCDSFKHKYDWSRHEKSLHLNMEEWICTPHGGSVVLPLTGRVHCAYCSVLDPTAEHLEQHNHAACVEGRSNHRVFRRKDHLVQHLRLVHGLETLPLIEDWKVEAAPVKSRCGFCGVSMGTWDERTGHLAAHFRQGKTMADWEGDHGFEPEVMSRLTNAFPPYLIAAQSTTLIPFSATDPAAIDHTNQLLSRIELEASRTNLTNPADQVPGESASLTREAVLPTQQEIDTTVFADMLSRHLSRFAREQMRLGIVPTDEMFQRESRRLLYYDGDDDWNQTVADDPKWLQEFKQRTGYAPT